MNPYFAHATSHNLRKTNYSKVDLAFNCKYFAHIHIFRSIVVIYKIHQFYNCDKNSWHPRVHQPIYCSNCSIENIHRSFYLFKYDAFPLTVCSPFSQPSLELSSVFGVRAI